MKDVKRITIKPILLSDQAWIEEFYTQRWGSNRVVSRGRLYNVVDLPGFIAWIGDTRRGLLTYQLGDREIEIVTMDSFEPGQGIGKTLISEAKSFARDANCSRMWLITTNDNMPALRFYQKNGFHLAKVHRDEIKISRALKPEIPFYGLDGIPIRDEMELEFIIT